MNSAFTPDLILFILIVIVLFMDLFLPEKNRANIILTTSALCMLALIPVLLWLSPEQMVLTGNYMFSPLFIPFKVCFLLCGFFTLLMARAGFVADALRKPLQDAGVFVILLLASVLGMFVLVSSRELITFFLGLELATLPMYALCTWHRDSSSTEAATKYVLVGALSTALFLFGASFLYGACGSLEFNRLASVSADNGFLKIGVIFILASLGFKLSAAPFHMWAPDVYEGAPTSVTAFIASGSKAAGVAALILLFKYPLHAVAADCSQAFMFLAVVSMVVGNLGAIKQKSFNRFMAYSSIAQVGFIFMALSGILGTISIPAIAFYMIVYACGNYAAFFVMQSLAASRPEHISSLRGLSKQSPILALCMMIAMFSLAGLPPLAGFLGKFELFLAAAEAGHYFLVFFAALNAVVALYYYMIVVKEAYIVEAEGELSPISTSPAQRYSLFLLVSALIVLGVYPAVHTWVFGLFGVV